MTVNKMTISQNSFDQQVMQKWKPVQMLKYREIGKAEVESAHDDSIGIFETSRHKTFLNGDKMIVAR